MESTAKIRSYNKMIGTRKFPKPCLWLQKTMGKSILKSVPNTFTIPASS